VFPIRSSSVASALSVVSKLGCGRRPRWASAARKTSVMLLNWSISGPSPRKKYWPAPLDRRCAIMYSTVQTLHILATVGFPAAGPCGRRSQAENPPFFDNSSVSRLVRAPQRRRGVYARLARPCRAAPLSEGVNFVAWARQDSSSCVADATPRPVRSCNRRPRRNFLKCRVLSPRRRFARQGRQFGHRPVIMGGSRLDRHVLDMARMAHMAHMAV
jgi:hypothetical protein